MLHKNQHFAGKYANAPVRPAAATKTCFLAKTQRAPRRNGGPRTGGQQTLKPLRSWRPPIRSKAGLGQRQTLPRHASARNQERSSLCRAPAERGTTRGDPPPLPPVPHNASNALFRPISPIPMLNRLIHTAHRVRLIEEKQARFPEAWSEYFDE